MSDSQDAAAALRREERQARRERLQAELQAEEERMKKAREERRRRREERDSARPATLTAADPHPASSASPTAATSTSPSSSKPGSRKASLDRETRRKRSADSAAALHRLNASDASAHAAEAAAAAASAPPSTTPAPAPPGGAVSSRTATTAPSNGRRSSVVILDEIELDRKRAVDKRKSDLEERRLKLDQDLKKTEEERERRQREREERIRKRREEAEDEEKATEALLEKQRHRRETEREEERRREEESRLKAEREASEREEKLKAERVRRQAEREARQRKIQEEADREMEALQKRRDEREAARKAKEAERLKAEEEREAERLAKRRAAEEARAKEEEERRVKEEEKQRVFAEESARRKQELEAMQANAIKTSVERRSSQEVEARKAAEAETQGKEKERTAALVRRMSQEDAKWERRRSQDLVERQRSQFMEEGLNSHKVMEEGKEEAKKNKKKKKEEEEKEEEDPLKKLERERAERRAKRDRELVEQAERAAAERKTRLEKERAESERRQKELEAEREKRAAERKMEIERERMKGEAERKRREEEEVERERARQRAREEREAERRAARERQQSGSGQHKRPSVDANVLPSTLKKQLSMPREEKKKEERKVVSRKASEVKAMFEPKAVTKSTESSVAANTTRGEDGEDGELFAALEKELASASLAEKDEVISQLLDSKNASSSSSSSSSSSRPPARKGSTTTVSGKAAPSKTTATKTTVIRSPPRMRRSTTASALGTNSSKAMTTTRISSPPSHRRGSSSTSQAAKTHEDASATVARMTRRNTDVDVASPRSSETTRAAAKRMPSSLSPSASAAQSALDKRNQELERIAMLRKKTRDEEHTKVERRTSGGRFEGVVAAASAFTPLAGRVASIKQQVEPKGTTEEKHAKRELERLAKERESARLADDAHEREELRRVQQEQETATRARREREREIERLAQEREKARLREEQEERKQRDQRDQAIRERERELNRIADEREAARLRAAGSTTSPVKRKTSSGGMASVAPGGGAAESGGTLERIAAERERRQKVEAERERERKAHLMQERQRSLGQREIKAALGATPVTAVDDTAVKRGEELETTKKAARDKLQAEEAERASRLEEKSKEREATRLAALQVVESARQAEVEKKQRDEQETKVKVEKTAASVSAAVAAETAKTEELLAERAAKRVAARRLSSEKSAADRAAMRAAVRSLSRERTVEEEEGKGTETKNHDESVPAKATSLARAMLVDTETKGDEESIAPMSPGRLDGRKLSEVAAPPPMLQEVPVVEVTLDETPTPSRLIHATRSRPKSVSSRRQTQGNPVRRTMRLGQSTSELLSSQEEAGGSGSDDNGDDKLPRASRSVSSSSAMDGSLEVMGAPEPNNEDGLGEEPSSSRPTRGRLPTSPPWSPPAGVRSSPRIRPLSESAVGSARSYRTPHGVSKEDVGGGRDGKRRVMLRDSSLPVKEFEPRMYLCKGKRKVYVQVVPAAMSSLCATDVFVYDARESVFVWYGKKASRVMRAKGLDLSTRIKDRERGGKVPVISFDQDQTGGKPRDKLRFYSELSGSVDEIRGADNSMDDSAYEKALAPRVRLYTLSETSMTTDDASDAVGDWQHVASGKELKTTLLDSSRVYVLDAWCAIFAWLGARAEGSCRTKAKNYATALVSQKESPGEAEVAAAERASRPDTAYYEIVRDKSEPSIFKEQFVDWAEGMTLHVRPVSNIERKEKTPYVTGADVVHVGTAEMARQISEEEGDALPDERWMQEVRGDDGKGKVTVYAVDVGGKAVEVDRKEHGIFYSAEAYVILYELSVRADAHILYVWRGDDTPKKRVGNVVPVAMDLGKRFSASHVNIEQGREPVHFASMFGGRIVVSRGARVDAGKASLQLYQVRGDAERVHAVECDTAHADRLVSDSSFVVLAGGDAFAFVWHGSRSTPAQREAALSSATLLTGIASPESAKQGAEPPALVSLLKMDTSVARNAGGGPMGRARAWQVSSVEGAGMDGKVTTQRIHFLKQADFDDESCLLVDGGAIVYAWAGPSARQSDVKVLLLLAHEYGQRVTGAREKDGVLDGYEHAADAVVAVSAGEEPVGLQSLVCGWSRRSSRDQHKRRTAQHARHSIVSTGNVAALLELTQQETVLSLDALRTTPRDQLPPTVDKARLEQHLSASDFLQTFAIDRSAFNKLPLWKQVVLRKKAGLF